MGGAGGGPPLAVLEKLDPVGWSTASVLLGFPQSLRWRPSSIRRSMCNALEGGAMILKKEMVLAKSSLRRSSWIYLLRIGSRNAAARVRRLPHWLDEC